MLYKDAEEIYNICQKNNLFFADYLKRKSYFAIKWPLKWPFIDEVENLFGDVYYVEMYKDDLNLDFDWSKQSTELYDKIKDYIDDDAYIVEENITNKKQIKDIGDAITEYLYEIEYNKEDDLYDIICNLKGEFGSLKRYRNVDTLVNLTKRLVVTKDLYHMSALLRAIFYHPNNVYFISNEQNFFRDAWKAFEKSFGLYEDEIIEAIELAIDNNLFDFRKFEKDLLK